MVSKDRKKKQNKKQWYAGNKEERRVKAHSSYTQNRQAVIHRAGNRMLTDQTLREQNAARVKARLQNDTDYKDANKARAANNDSKHRNDPQSREQHLLTMRERIKTKLTDMKYREEHQGKMRLHMKKRSASDQKYRERHQTQMRERMKTRIVSDEKYRERHQTQMRERMKSKIVSDRKYRERHRCNMKRMYNVNIAYRDATKTRSKQRYNRVRNLDNRQRNVARKYWARRTEVIAAARQAGRLSALQKKMQSNTRKPLFDIKLLFNKAERQLRRGRMVTSRLHSNLSTTANDCLQHLPTDRNPTEGDLTSAFHGHRIHTSCSEPYFWQQCYNLYTLTDAIAVDRDGKAHIFKPVTVSSESATDTADAESQTVSNRRWECDSRLCHLPAESVDGVTTLLRRIAAKNSANCRQFYLHLNDCNNPARNNRLGHSIYCCTDNGCHSLLRPARILSPHFPSLRSLVSRLYEVCRLVLSMHSVTTAMNSGDYDRLNVSVKDLNSTMKLSVGSNKSASTEASDHTVDEDSVVQQFGQALRHVTSLRDTYVTSSCDICEQLRKDLAPLTAYKCRPGYDSDRMRDALDLLYQHKTQEEDFDKFVDNIQICKYCAEKLRGNKDVARSFFNQLNVVPTPDCITQLNLFERALIKFCMTCITVVRLGQVTNASRPRKELTAALKGRIAYLPVDLQSNARFLPDNLLNVQSLVLLVGGQPTQQHRVWTSVVDLRKVQTALAWLRTNNPLYKDIPVYTIHDIEDIIAKQLDGQVMQTSPDSALLKKLTDASKSHLYENFSVQPLSSDYPADVLVDYQMDKVHGQSSDLFDAELDLKAFPELFPTGEHGLKDSNRTVKIGTSDYIKSRLLHKNPKFRLNINYLFHCFQVQEVSNMCHSIGHMLRTVTGKSLTAQAFAERLRNRDGEVQSKMFSMMANLRGSKEYFVKLGMDLKWMIKRLGPPTLFVTCSTAEWFSEALIDHLKTINKDVPGTDSMTPAELCCMDPVTVSIHFQQKWNAIFSKLIKDKTTPVFGEVEDHFWRIEYQSRGAPHVHCILWIKNAPILGRNTTEEVQQYINSICTCSMPNADTSPTLHNLVQQFQVHKCNKYCTKSYKRQGSFYKKCRFGFPRPVRAEIEVSDVIDCMAISRNKQPRKRLYQLPRNDSEQYVNDYNPALLLANQANVDVQYIGHLGSRLPYYITDYITKHERSEQDAMWHDIFTSTKTLGSNAMSFLLKSIKSRQVGANEAADRLLGHKLHSKSRQLRFADLAPSDKAKRVLKPASQIDFILKNNPDSCDIFQLHWVLDVYPDRPDELESCSLHEFLGWFEKEMSTRKKSEQFALKTHCCSLRRRKDKPYIVTHQTINPNQSDEHKELYFYYLLKLFKPWRTEADLCLPGKSYYKTYNIEKSSLPEMKSYHEMNVQISEQEQDMEKAITERAQSMRQAQEEGVAAEDQESAFDGCRTDHLRTAMQDVIDAHVRSVQQNTADNGDLTEAYNELNEDQRRVVNKVVTSVCNQQQPLHLIVSGQGGTGKSRVIDILNRIISQKMTEVSLPVVIAAPTGLAAFNIGGTTIHRVLSLPVEHGKPANYSRLQQEQLTLLRATLKGMKLLIIDEVSMVSSLTLLFIHMRLTEIMSCDELFGGINIVFFADFLQLPPVKGNQPFIPVTFLEAKQRLGAIASIDVWKSFEYDELTINMRQNGDREYADLLSNLRVGKLTDDHYRLLEGRQIIPGLRATVSAICQRYNQLVEEDQFPLILMPKTSLCDEVNTAMLNRIGNEIQKLTAVDNLDTITDKKIMKKVQQAYDKCGEDVTRTAGLEKDLQLCIGCKVMLKRNKNVDAGLVNGSIGTVVAFNKSSVNNTNTINSITVKFEKIETTVDIERDSASFEVLKSIYYTRKQFPLMLAFAITIHKSQGLSLHTAIVDAGSTNFGCGMVYVALSRVTSLSGLHLIDLDRSKITCDQKAVDEYNRLRRLYTPNLGELKAEDSSGTSCAPRQNSRDKRKQADAQLGKGVTRKKPRHSKDNSTEVNKLPPVSDEVGLRTFDCCETNSLDEPFQQTVCMTLNLRLFKHKRTTMSPSHTEVATQLEQYIYTQTAIRKNATAVKISGDGNCLFRALSYAITRSQTQHEVLRMYIANYMMQPDVANRLQQLFATADRPEVTHMDHVLTMQDSGQWGTEEEIATAAHLLGCSIVCFSKYSDNRFCLQHFPPHFIEMTQCTSSCKHKTVYLINTSGTHYECAIVRDTETSSNLLEIEQ